MQDIVTLNGFSIHNPRLASAARWLTESGQVQPVMKSFDNLPLFDNDELRHAATVAAAEAEERRGGKNVQSSPDIRRGQSRTADAPPGIEYA